MDPENLDAQNEIKKLDQVGSCLTANYILYVNGCDFKFDSLLCFIAQVLGSRKQGDEVPKDKSVVETSLTEAVKPTQQDLEQQRRQEAVVQKDRVSTLSHELNIFTK